MSTLELKNALTQRISGINDKSFLEAVKTILDTKSESKSILLTKEIINEISESRKEIEKGLFHDNDSVEEEFEKRLNEG